MAPRALTPQEQMARFRQAELERKYPTQRYQGGTFSDIMDFVATPQAGLTGMVQGIGWKEGVRRMSTPSQAAGIQGTVGGFALDVLADPSNFVGVGALSKAGKAAQTAGKLRGTLGGQALAGQRSLLSFGGAPILSGKTALPAMTRATNEFANTGVGQWASKALRTPQAMAPSRSPLSMIDANAVKAREVANSQRALRLQMMRAEREGLLKSNQLKGQLLKLIKEDPTITTRKLLEDADSVFKGKGIKNAYQPQTYVQLTKILDEVKEIPAIRKQMTDVLKEQGLSNVASREAVEALSKKRSPAPGVKEIKGEVKLAEYSKLRGADGKETLVKLNKTGTKAKNLSTDKLAFWKIADNVYTSVNPKKMSDNARRLLRAIAPKGKLANDVDLKNLKTVEAYLKSKNLDPLYKGDTKKQVNKALRASQNRVAASAAELNDLRAAQNKAPIFTEDLPTIIGKMVERGMVQQAKENFAKEIAKVGLTIPRTRSGKRLDTRKAIDRTFEQLGISRDVSKKNLPGANLLNKNDPLLDELALLEAGVPSPRTFVNGVPSGWKALDHKALGMPDLKDVYLPETVTNQIEELTRAFTQIDTVKDFMRMYDNINNTFKTITTVVNPAYHVRNFVGNTWTLYMAGVKNPAHAARATKILSKFDPTIPYEEAIKKLDPEDVKILSEFRDTGSGGVSQVMEVAMDIDRTRDMGALGRQHNKLTEGINKLTEQTQKLDDFARLTLFIDRRSKGFNPSEASMEVVKHFFDYSDMSPFEKNVLKRVYPFYSWVRNNVPYQVGMLLNEPGKIAVIGKAANNLNEDGGVDPELIPEWMKEAYPVYFGQGSDGAHQYFTLNGWIPSVDLSIFGTPERIVTDIGVPKMLIEPFANYSFFTNAPIQEYEGQLGTLSFPGGHSIDMPVRMAYALKYLRPLNDWNRLQDMLAIEPEAGRDDTRLRDGLMQFFTGSRLRNLYEEDLVDMKTYRDQMKLNAIKRDIRRRERFGRDTSVQEQRLEEESNRD